MVPVVNYPVVINHNNRVKCGFGNLSELFFRLPSFRYVRTIDIHILLLCYRHKRQRKDMFADYLFPLEDVICFKRLIDIFQPFTCYGIAGLARLGWVTAAIFQDKHSRLV